jgi:tripartite-type tricarboxylate transporter receptor subunit TctC
MTFCPQLSKVWLDRSERLTARTRGTVIGPRRRKTFAGALRSIVACMLLAPLGTVHAQPAPACALTRFIIAYPAGGPTDGLGRVIAQKLGEKWGRTVVVENRGGGGTVIATDIVAKAPPDGCTLLLTASPFANNPFIYPKLPYDTGKDLAPVTLLVFSPQILVVNPEFPAKNVKDLIDYAAKHPGQVSFASSGTLGTGHLSGELLSSMSKQPLLHIPYKGSAPAYADVITGRVPMMFDSGGPMIEHIKAGKLRALAVTSEKRSPALPGVPTVAESGLPGYVVNSWNGIVTTGGTPKETIAKIGDDLNFVLAQPDVRERLAQLSYETVGGSPAEFEAFIRSEATRWGTLIRERNLRPD